MRVIKAPKAFHDHGSAVSVFLAGSIDMGNAIDWQSYVENDLSIYPDDVLTVLSPRRDDFQAYQRQSIDNPYFKEQVTWEMTGLEESDFIFMYFEPNTKAPITLLELGLFAADKHIIIVCPASFWRKGNVDIVADQYGLPVYDTLEDGITELHRVIEREYDVISKDDR